MPPKQEPVEDLSDIPKALVDLMKANNVTIEEIQDAVASRGYYPNGTPIKNYDPNFVSGVLVAAWAQVFNMIEMQKQNNKDCPF
jgi:sulfur relay (sulfurtransferase) complex TusBCD TusD component (DsrE family)